MYYRLEVGGDAARQVRLIEEGAAHAPQEGVQGVPRLYIYICIYIYIYIIFAFMPAGRDPGFLRLYIIYIYIYICIIVLYIQRYSTLLPLQTMHIRGLAFKPVHMFKHEHNPVLAPRKIPLPVLATLRFGDTPFSAPENPASRFPLPAPENPAAASGDTPIRNFPSPLLG